MPEKNANQKGGQGGGIGGVLKNLVGGGKEGKPPSGHEVNPNYQPVTGAEKARQMRKEKDNTEKGKPTVREVHIRQSTGHKSVEVVKAYTTTEYKDKKTGKVRYTKTKVHVRRFGETPAQAKARRAKARKVA